MLASLARSCLWLFLRKGLLHLGEQYPAEANSANTSNIGNEDDRYIMPMQLMLLYAAVAVCMTVGTMGFCAAWEQCINVIPTRIMVLAPNNALRAPDNYSLDGQFNDEKSTTSMLGQPKAKGFFGPWNLLPNYLFFLFNLLQSDLVPFVKNYLPVNDFGRHLVFVGVALLLCPLQFAATVATISQYCSKGTENSTSTRKKSSDDSYEGNQPSRKLSIRVVGLYLMKAVAALYSWLAPATIFWAISTELSKEGALMLSRYLSLAQYAADHNPLFNLSTSDVALVCRKAACVLALYMFLWTALALPATIAMRRVHASSWIFSDFETFRAIPIDNQIRNRNQNTKGQALSPLSAWQSFAWQPYRRLLAVYACGFLVLPLVAMGGMQLSMTALASSFDAFRDKYEGWWMSLFLRLTMAVGKSS